MHTNIHSGTALITGATSRFGAAFAARLAREGHDIILVASGRRRLCALASDITDTTGRSVEVLAVDLLTPAGLRSVERVLTADASVTVLVNNAGWLDRQPAPAAARDEAQTCTVDVEFVPSRLAAAACKGFSARGGGTIVNIAPVQTATSPGPAMPKLVLPRLDQKVDWVTTLVIAFSRLLHQEHVTNGISIRTVLPDADGAGCWVVGTIDQPQDWFRLDIGLASPSWPGRAARRLLSPSE